MEPTRIIAILLMGLLFLSCTENPFEDESTVNDTPRRVQGRVETSPRGSDEGVYIWLESFNLAAKTAADGIFILTLPPPSTQGTPGGVSGVFQLYVYLGNYRLAIVPMPVKNGVFSYPSDRVNERGELRIPVSLNQIFSIDVEVSKGVISSQRTELFNVIVRMVSVSGTVRVHFPRRVNDTEGPLLLRNQTTGETKIFSSVVAGPSLMDEVAVGPAGFERVMLATIPAGSLPTGTYDVIPYLLYKEQYVPPGLYASLGKNVTDLSPEYVRLPFRRTRGTIVVQ